MTRTHGESRTLLYGVWTAMKARCQNPNTLHYQDYGGRGIAVCPEWQEYEPFRTWARSHGYAAGAQIDRINNDGPYSPDNCHFTVSAVQTRNKRSNVHVTAFGETKIMADWLTDPRCTVTNAAIKKRLADGWTPEDAITAPPRSRTKRRAPKAKCINGHDFTPDNTRIDVRGARQCITCERQRGLAWYHNHKPKP